MFEIVSVNTDRKQGDFMRDNPEMLIKRFDRKKDHKLSTEELTLAGPKARGERKPPMNPEMRPSK